MHLLHELIAVLFFSLQSFNLKPAVVSRPSIQGPKTNLRVAAILEKANAIRQVTLSACMLLFYLFFEFF